MLSPFKKLFRRGEVDCKEVRRLSSDYLEDGLAPPKHSAILAHLSRCGPCRAFVETLASTIGFLSRLPRVPAPSSSKQSILDNTSRAGEGEAT